MAKWTPPLIQLRNDLASIFDDARVIGRIVDEAGVPREAIDFNGAARDIWHDTFNEVQNLGRMDNLLEVVLSAYPRIQLAQTWLAYIMHDVELPPDVVQSCFWQSCRHILERRLEIASHQEAAKILWEVADHSKRYTCILEYSERLARHTATRQVAGQLRRWITQSVQNDILNVTTDEFQHLQQRLDLEQSQRNTVTTDTPALLVEISPDPFSRKGNMHRRYHLRVSLWRSERDIVCWYGQDTETFRFDQIAQKLYDILNDNANEKPAIIEFFLPYELLVCNVDQWHFQMKQFVQGQPDLPSRISSRYKVVVRSLDRIRNGSGLIEQEWREKWDAFHRRRETCKILWLYNPQDFPKLQELYEELMEPVEKTVCVSFNFLPVSSMKNAGENGLLATILMAGVPIMIWSRKYGLPHVDSMEVKKELEMLLGQENLANLPNAVHKLRTNKEIRNYPEHLGNHITLFWDDPNRKPVSVNRNQSAL